MSASKIVLNILYVCTTVLLFILIAFGLLKAGTWAYDMGYRVFTEQPVDIAPGTDVVVEVSQEMSSMELGTVLEEKGLIDDAGLFVLQMKLSAYADKVKPGLYTLNTAQTAKEMLKVMSAEPEEEEEETE